MIDETAIRNRYEAMRAGLDERERRLLAAAEARTAGYGGVSAVARATGIARSTIDRGLKDLESLDPVQPKVRRPGGGRRSLIRTDPTVLEDLRRLLEPATVGDPMRPLMWVSKSHAKLAAALRDMGHEVSASRIPKLLECLRYRRQVNRKTKEGSRHPDRDAQFEHINQQVVTLQAAGQPRPDAWKLGRVVSCQAAAIISGLRPSGVHASQPDRHRMRPPANFDLYGLAEAMFRCSAGKGGGA